MMYGFMGLATLQFERKLQKCIRMGIPYSKSSFGEVFYWIYVGNHVLRLRSGIAVKPNFRPYIQQFTSPNENFEYSYPLIETSRVWVICRFGLKHVK